MMCTTPFAASTLAVVTFASFGSSECAMVPLGRSAKASLVGAKTVKGPAPERAPVRLPAVRAATSVERSGVATASSTMFCVGLPSPYWWGMRTWSMMCTTPFVASTSAVITFALFTKTAPSRFTIVTVWPLSVLTRW